MNTKEKDIIKRILNSLQLCQNQLLSKWTALILSYRERGLVQVLFLGAHHFSLPQSDCTALSILTCYISIPRALRLLVMPICPISYIAKPNWTPKIISQSSQEMVKSSRSVYLLLASHPSVSKATGGSWGIHGHCWTWCDLHGQILGWKPGNKSPGNLHLSCCLCFQPSVMGVYHDVSKIRNYP